MRVGIAPAGSRDAATAVRMAQLAEQRGLAELWLSEDYLERGAFTVAGGVAAATTRITIGLGVINPWTRHVGLAAMESAALDELSGGRLIVGLGASNERWMQGMLGIAFERPVSTLLEYAGALRALLAGEQLDRTVGAHHVRAGLSFLPPRADLPIFLGVKGPVALRRGSPVADGLMLSVLSTPQYVTWVRETYAPKRLTAYAFFSSDPDPDRARGRLKARTGRFLGMHGPSPITLIPGLSEDLAAEFRARALRGEDATDLVSDDIVDLFTIAGDQGECVRGLHRFAQAGLDSLVVLDDGESDPEIVVEAISAAAISGGYIAA